MGWLVLLVVAACGGSATGHEDLGDEHYRQGRFAEAVTEYRLAQASQPLAATWAKLGAAALHAGEVSVAVEAYAALADGDPTRVAEAARGLERAARLPQAGPEAVKAAVEALQRLVPDRPLGRLAVVPGAMAGSRVATGSLLPGALAGAGSGADVDQVLVKYAGGLRASSGCAEATGVYRTALRRGRDPDLLREARAGLTSCALRLGQQALEADRPEVAEQWFAEASAADAGGLDGLVARIGWGDARLRQGDVLGAALTWQSVVSAVGATDSLRQVAADRINALASAGTPDGGDSRR